MNSNSLSEINSHADTIWVPAYDICLSAKLERYLLDCEKLRCETYQKTKSPGESLFTLFSSTYKNARKDSFDDENSLYQLYKFNYSYEKAKAHIPTVWKSMKHINGARLTYTEPWRQFTDDDCNIFELGLRTYGKNFFMIKTNLVYFLLLNLICTKINIKKLYFF